MWKAGYDRINREGWNEMIKIVLWNKPSPVLMIFVCINNLKMWIDTIFFLFFLILRLLSKIYGSQVSCLTIDRNFRFTPLHSRKFEAITQVYILCYII